jgi:hypothetical protein
MRPSFVNCRRGQHSILTIETGLDIRSVWGYG